MPQRGDGGWEICGAHGVDLRRSDHFGVDVPVNASPA